MPADAARYRTIIGDRSAVVSFVSVTEIRYGAARAGWEDLRRRALERDLSAFVVIQPDDRVIRFCADLRAACEDRGHALGQKIHEADRWIAASAIALEVALVSDDAIFSDVPDLTLLPGWA